MTDGAGSEGPPASSPGPRRQRRLGALILMGALLSFGVVAGTALGIWQIERRAWKLDLIERVATRAHQAAEEAPGPADWPSISRDASEYLRVFAIGRFRHQDETLVRAVTDLGAGYWVLTPLDTERGFTVLVNRGFVPPEKKDPAARGAAPADERVAVAGLLRLTEPKGGFLRANAPAEERWYSRDVDAIAAARGLRRVAPYFIDADASGEDVGVEAGAYPVGGLTRLSFSNHHLVYALTWFALALMSLLMGLRLIRDAAGTRRRR